MSEVTRITEETTDGMKRAGTVLAQLADTIRELDAAVQGLTRKA